jgi:uncharacterized protein (TIGR02118 family)
MIRVLYILQKRADLSDAAFREYWKSTHGPIVAKIPGLRKYVESHPYPDPHGDPLPADGVAELEFDSIEAMQAALSTAEGQAMLADVANFVDTQRAGPIVIEEDYQIV